MIIFIKHRYAMTLIELMVVIIIIGILASAAIPMFSRAMETTRAKEAVSALQQLRTGERVYRVEENRYWASSDAGGVDEIKEINKTLRVFLDYRYNRNWDYSLDSSTTATFIGTATRRSGRNRNEIITIDQYGYIGKSNWSP